ncbi:hypothetical protein [Streptomyces sp. NPDC057675]|uniref:hypothetical protein n=1 Tax=Streptomyces sp. NPDC057675 TaxID=3346204 RepID=UPI0036CF92FD
MSLQPGLADVVGELTGDTRRTAHAAEQYQDFDLSSYEDAVLAYLEEHLVRARNNTRLLEHEKAAIRAPGLRLLNAQLVNDRLDRAHFLGHLTGAERQMLRSVNEMVPKHRGWGVRTRCA